jgi:hypothetical protein
MFIYSEAMITLKVRPIDSHPVNPNVTVNRPETKPLVIRSRVDPSVNRRQVDLLSVTTSITSSCRRRSWLCFVGRSSTLTRPCRRKCSKRAGVSVVSRSLLRCCEKCLARQVRVMLLPQ